MKRKRNIVPDDSAQKSSFNEDCFFGRYSKCDNLSYPESISDGCIHLKYGDLYPIYLNIDLL